MFEKVSEDVAEGEGLKTNVKLSKWLNGLQQWTLAHINIVNRSNSKWTTLTLTATVATVMLKHWSHWNGEEGPHKMQNKQLLFATLMVKCPKPVFLSDVCPTVRVTRLRSRFIVRSIHLIRCIALWFYSSRVVRSVHYSHECDGANYCYSIQCDMQHVCHSQIIYKHNRKISSQNTKAFIAHASTRTS